jgi:hypothetical protein
MNDEIVWREIQMDRKIEAEITELAYVNGVSFDMMISMCCHFICLNPELMRLKPIPQQDIPNPA